MEGTDLDAFERLLEGEGHTTSDNERVDLDRGSCVSGKSYRWWMQSRRTLSNMLSIS